PPLPRAHIPFLTPFYFSFVIPLLPADLLSFPTRRSSDLTSFGADGEDMAPALADDGFDAGFERVELGQGDKGLHGAGKAAPVDPDGPFAGQQVLGGGDGDGHLLVLGVAGGDDVLQVFPAAAARLVDQGQEGVKVPGAQGGHLLFDPLVVGVDVEGPQHGPVAAGLAAGGDVGQEGLEGDAAQHVAAADGGHRPAVGGDGGVLVGQVGVVGARIKDAQSKAGLGEVHLDRLDHGIGGVGKVDGDDVAHTGSHLVHQAAGLAEVDVFSPLADLGDGDGADLFGHEQLVEDGADQHLVGGAGGHAAALGHVGGDVDVQAVEGRAALGKGGALAPQDGGAGVLLLLAGGKVRKVDDAQGVPLALDAQLAQAVGACGGDHVDVDAARQHPAVLVVGVVAADLG